MGRKRRIAFIVPRYEPVSAGGAEVHAQRLAEKVKERGHNVEVFTTCARDHFTWKNFYEPGKKMINDIRVWRFRVNLNRRADEFLAIQSRIDRRLDISGEEEIKWVKESVNSDELYDYIAKYRRNYDCFIFIPYLFGLTYWGTQVCPEKSILIPCLHDEPFAYLKIYKDLFHRVKGLMCNTFPEIELAKELYRLPDEKITMVSLGFETGRRYNPENFRKKYALRAPFVLFAGRREGGKNTPLLIEYFRTYKRYNKNDLKLVLMGTGEVNIPPEGRKEILDLGYLKEAGDKLGGFSAALVFCQPSVNESLSIVTMESWLSGRPVLVHHDCRVTRDNCRRSRGGLFFKNYFEFEECLNFFLREKELADRMGENGRRYVEKNYSWPAVLDRFEEALDKFGV